MDNSSPSSVSSPSASSPSPLPSANPTTNSAPLDPKSNFKLAQACVFGTVIALIVIAISAYWIWNTYGINPADSGSDGSNDTSEESNQIPPTEPDPTPETDATTTFTGTAITAQLPEGWSIVETFDGEGSNTLVEQTVYDGLTSLEVFTPISTLAFSLEAIYGIGFSSYCEDYFQFPDNDTQYQQGIIDTNQEIGEAVPNIISISSDSFTSFSLLGTDVRRVNNQLYWDTESGDSYFQAACGGSARLFTLADIWFVSDPGTVNTMENHSYQWYLSDMLTDEQYETLDGILESMEVI